MRVDLVVLGLAAVDGFHGQRMPQDERDALGGAEVSQPVPAEQAFDRDGQVLAVGRDGDEEGVPGGRAVAMQQDMAGGVEDAEVHHLHVEIDSAGVPVLLVVESHTLSSCAAVRTHPATSLLVASSRRRAE